MTLLPISVTHSAAARLTDQSAADLRAGDAWYLATAMEHCTLVTDQQLAEGGSGRNPHIFLDVFAVARGCDGANRIAADRQLLAR